MKRRSFLVGLLALPLVKYLPTPKPALVLAAGSDQVSIWLINWSPGIYEAARRPGWRSCTWATRSTRFQTCDRPVRINFLKRELNK